jgi:hypothetical protein
VLALVASLVPAAAGEKPPLLTSDAGARAATLHIVAGENDGFTFNGYANGALVVAVPTGWTLTVEMRNTSASVQHSILVVSWSDRFKGSGLTPAFAGAAAPDFEKGITSGDAPIRFTFTADAPGRESLVCGVPGHNLVGMWDELDVIDGISAPSYRVKTP